MRPHFPHAALHGSSDSIVTPGDVEQIPDALAQVIKSDLIVKVLFQVLLSTPDYIEKLASADLQNLAKLHSFFGESKDPLDPEKVRADLLAYRSRFLRLVEKAGIPLPTLLALPEKLLTKLITATGSVAAARLVKEVGISCEFLLKLDQKKLFLLLDRSWEVFRLKKANAPLHFLLELAPDKLQEFLDAFDGLILLAWKMKNLPAGLLEFTLRASVESINIIISQPCKSPDSSVPSIFSGAEAASPPPDSKSYSQAASPQSGLDSKQLFALPLEWSREVVRLSQVNAPFKRLLALAPEELQEFLDAFHELIVLVWGMKNLLPADLPKFALKALVESINIIISQPCKSPDSSVPSIFSGAEAASPPPDSKSYSQAASPQSGEASTGIANPTSAAPPQEASGVPLFLGSR